MTRIRLAVVGAGHLGRIHARLACTLPEFELVGVVDPMETSRNAVATENSVPGYARCEEIADRIDAAIVATPTAHHFATCSQLLARGVHVLVEKPITLNAADADELVHLAHAKCCTLQVGHVERFNPAFRTALPAMHRPRLLDSVRTAPYTFRSIDVGVVLDLMIHDIDLVLSLVQTEVRRIDAVGGDVFGPNEDWAQARLQFAGGAVANLFASRVCPTVQRTLQVIDATGFHTVDFQAKTTRHVLPSDELRRGEIHPLQLSPVERDQIKSRLFDDHLVMTTPAVVDCNAILEEQRDFIASISEGTAVRCSGEAGRDAVAVAEQILAQLAAAQEAAPLPMTLPFRAPLPQEYRRAG